jgi:carbamoyltransferase
MYILGINISHHASICLLKDGETIFYLEDDRLTGCKEVEFTLDNPMLSLKKILSHTNYVDYVVFASYGKNGYARWPDEIMIDYIVGKLNDYEIKHGEVHFKLEHHLYHATNAFYSSTFDEAATLILDGGGVKYNDYIRLLECESMYYFSGTEYETIKKVYGSCDIYFKQKPEKHNDVIFSSTLSCGWIFNTLSHITGTVPGKVMGLASYGNIKNIDSKEWFLYDEDCDIWYTDNEEILNCYTKYSNDVDLNPMDHDNICKYDETFAQDIARRAQEETKDHAIRLIGQLLGKCNTKNIVLSGGYFLNCVNNYEYLAAFPNINFYIDPIAHDGGICLGAAKYLWHCIMGNTERHPLKTLYLG